MLLLVTLQALLAGANLVAAGYIASRAVAKVAAFTFQ